jgi:UDP-N-acetylmuramyl pentapeptide synthase
VNVREASLLMSAGVADAGAEFFDNEIIDFSIDSRSVRPGELFFALSQEDYVRAGFNGAFHDGHQFIESAFERGAVAAVARTDRVAVGQSLQMLKGRLLLVDDAIAALQTLAHRVYEAWGNLWLALPAAPGKLPPRN